MKAFHFTPRVRFCGWLLVLFCSAALFRFSLGFETGKDSSFPSPFQLTAYTASCLGILVAAGGIFFEILVLLIRRIVDRHDKTRNV
jgi:hypothetical protein